MKVVVSSDEHTHLVQALLAELQARGHEVDYLGPEKGEEADWPLVSLEAAQRVARGEASEGIVMCWTGTGATLVANKVPGIRAALCPDAETARGARLWNHANVLGLSLRTTSEPILKEILDAWFSTPFSQDEWNRKQIERIREIESRFAGG
ncbi:MAG: RpiB/LacA/LacB family sugar-phosphate isomerase [Anaerolineales bacterium]|jgi:ribose 5-phosphate isomerase B